MLPQHTTCDKIESVGDGIQKNAGSATSAMAIGGVRVMSTLLLRSKLYVPPVRAEWVSRPRLIERLNSGLHRKLTLISAPAGFGKTTLLAGWIHSAGTDGHAPSIAWLSLDEGDNDPARFWAYALAALDTLRPGLGDGARAFLRSAGPADAAAQPAIETALTAILNDLAAAGADTRQWPAFVLVLDDYHLIEAQPIHQGLAFLVEHLPPQFHLVISGRADPPLPLPRLRARGDLTELRVADLRFTVEEATTFLNDAIGLSLMSQDVAALEARTEGWIAGLHLAALALQGMLSTGVWDPQRAAHFIATFSGSHRYVLDYLVEEVLQQQPEPVQDFLLQTSILSRLTGPLCDAVLDTGGPKPDADKASVGSPHPDPNTQSPLSEIHSPGQRMLEHLEAANLFILPLDGERRWYRYHRLFADLLHARLQDRCPTAPLHRRAAEWYEQNGLPQEGIGHALAVQDFGRATRLIEQCADEMLWANGQVATLLRWLEMLPGELIRSQPNLCLLRAWAFFLSAQFKAAEAVVQDATVAFQTAALPDQERQNATSQITVMQALLANFRGDLPRTIELSRRALDLVPDDNAFLRGSLAGNLGGAYTRIGDMAAAAQAFSEAMHFYATTGNTFIALIASSYLGAAQAALGQLRDAAETYRQALELAASRGATQSLGARLAHVGLGSLLCEWNELEAAAHHLKSGIDLVDQPPDLSLGPGQQLLVDGYLGLARVRQALGDAEAALELVHKAWQTAEEHAPAQLARVAATRARIWIAQGNLHAAARWAQESGLTAADEPAFHREFETLTLARVLLADSQSADALGLLERLRRAAEAGSRMGSAIEARVLQALTLEGQGQTAEALAALGQALSLAEPEGYVRLFADEGAPLADLLRQATSQGIARNYVNRLLTAFAIPADRDLGARLRRPEGAPPPSSPVFHPPRLVEPLTDRELEVLRLIAVGLSNREIAEELVLAVTTVKKHASNIYGKLGIRSRTQAVARAEELGLL
jgi:LuxR family maltose regulon positive regulatory protein